MKVKVPFRFQWWKCNKKGAATAGAWLVMPDGKIAGGHTFDPPAADPIFLFYRAPGSKAVRIS